jgi:hypothetical protein
VFYYENNMSSGFILNTWLVLAIAYFYFLIRPRRFFASKHHLYFTRDFRLGMISIDLACITDVRLTNYKFEFVCAGKSYRFFIFGKSNQLLRELLKGYEDEINISREKHNIAREKHNIAREKHNISREEQIQKA